MNSGPGVTEMRLVVTAADYEEALRFYRDTLGLPERAAYSSPGGRVAFQVGDSAAVAGSLAAAGARVIAGPTLTPWKSVNTRLEAPADLQLTLFSEQDT